MLLRYFFLLIGVFCFSCSAHTDLYAENGIFDNQKTHSSGLGLSLFPEGLTSSGFKLPEDVSDDCKEDFDRYRNAILNPSRDTLWAYKSKKL